MSNSNPAPTGSKPTSSSKYVGNEGKNTVGRTNGGQEAYGKGAGEKEAARGKKSRKALYGFKNAGPARAKIPRGNDDPDKKKKVSVKTEAADPDKAAPVKEGKIKVVKNAIQTTGSLSHGRVGKEQKMCSFGSPSSAQLDSAWNQGAAHWSLFGSHDIC